MKQEKVVLHS